MRGCHFIRVAMHTCRGLIDGFSMHWHGPVPDLRQSACTTFTRHINSHPHTMYYTIFVERLVNLLMQKDVCMFYSCIPKYIILVACVDIELQNCLLTALSIWNKNCYTSHRQRKGNKHKNSRNNFRVLRFEKSKQTLLYNFKQMSSY